MASAGLALMVANLRFWTTVAPVVSRQLARWEQQAKRIEDPILHALALQKLSEEHFNAQVAATLSTTAPAEHRQAVVEAIVAYEVIYDYLDGLTEQPLITSLASARDAYKAFTDAIQPDTETSADYYASLDLDDNGYLARLVAAVRDSLQTLPSWSAASHNALTAAVRCTEAQARAHTTPGAALESWAKDQADDGYLGWQEFLAGAASSVLAVHALIAAAAEPQLTSQDAAGIDRAYLSICALSTILDGLVDYEQDQQAAQAGYLGYYQDDEQVARSLAQAARHAIQNARELPHAAHHLMTLVGVAGYYTSAPTAKSHLAQAGTRQLRRELSPLITPVLGIMRAWRAAKRLSRAIHR